MTRLPSGLRWWAAASGVTGLIAAVFLVLFYVTAKPWTASTEPEWFGRANDILTTGQYIALVPVIYGLGRLLSGDAWARIWTRVGLAACIALIVLQLLLITGVLPFAIQVVPASLSAIATICWAGAISAAGARTHALPPAVIRLGRALVIGLPIVVAVFAAGFVVTIVSGVTWAWAAGAIPGGVVWLMFPLWSLLLAVNTPGHAGTSIPARRYLPR